MPKIKQAAIEDIELLMQWRMEVLRHVFALSPDDARPELYAANLAYYKAALQSGEHIAALAEKDNAVVGCGGVCLYQEMPSPDNPSGQCAYLMNVYVREEFRGQGIGKAIVKWLVEQAQKRHITKIYLETSKQAKPLYAGLGFTDMPDYMKL